MPRIAVVIPLYNHAGFIGPALDSVLGQTRRPNRIIVVDDGSSDGSAGVAEKFQDRGVELIRQENQGAHTALNRGVQAADDCEWIAILNSDDVFTSTRLARGLDALAGLPQTELLCTSLHLIDDQGVPLPESSPKVKRLKKVRDLLLASADPLLPLGISNYAKTTSNFIARRRFLLAHPFAAYRFVHDYHLMLIAAFGGQLSVLPEDLLGYRIHGTNTIKASGKSAVIAETVQMNLDLLAAHAEMLRIDPALARRWRLYLQQLLGNHTDFRGEIFVRLVAGLLAGNPSVVAQSIPADSPEYALPSDPLPVIGKS